MRSAPGFGGKPDSLTAGLSPQRETNGSGIVGHHSNWAVHPVLPVGPSHGLRTIHNLWFTPLRTEKPRIPCSCNRVWNNTQLSDQREDLEVPTCSCGWNSCWRIWSYAGGRMTWSSPSCRGSVGLRWDSETKSSPSAEGGVNPRALCARHWSHAGTEQGVCRVRAEAGECVFA